MSLQMQLRPVREAWFAHPELQLVLERLLTRKPPSSDDLRNLMPTVWWPGKAKQDGGFECMQAATSGFASTLNKVGLPASV